MKNCPCNPKKEYKDCCAIIHKDISQATTAEQMMRSRYSAFVLSDVAYLQRSHLSSLRPNKQQAKDLEKWTKSVNWIKLNVLNTTDGLENDTTGTVEFKAFYLQKGKVQVLHEVSRFCKENDHWVYQDQIG